MNKGIIGIVLGGALAVAGFAAETEGFANDREKVSYGLGMNMGSYLSRMGVALDEVDLEVMLQGFQDGIAGGDTRLKQEEMVQTLQTFQTDARKRLADANKAKGEAFLAENREKEGVQTLEVALRDGQSAELQYKVLTEGSGDSPKPSDSVVVNYRGTLIDGTEFDSSYKNGKPATFGVNRVIRGWTEALQRMSPGAKWELYIPGELAYGDRGSGRAIGPNETLIFEVEMLEVKPAAPPKPVTSDIIKVPSKAEMEKGAQIEVIKASELEEYKAREAEKKSKQEADPEGGDEGGEESGE